MSGTGRRKADSSPAGPLRQATRARSSSQAAKAHGTNSASVPGGLPVLTSEFLGGRSAGHLPPLKRDPAGVWLKFWRKWGPRIAVAPFAPVTRRHLVTLPTLTGNVTSCHPN